MIRQKRTSYLTLCVSILLALPLAPRKAASASPPVGIAQEIDAEFGYVGGATTRGGGANIGSVDELSSDLKYVFSPQVTKRLLLRFGAEWQRSSFGVPGSATLPDVLQQVSAIVGFDWQFTGQWLLRVELQPGVYSDFQDVSWHDVDAPMLVSAAYVVDADLQWFFGFRVDVRSQYPVVPGIGVRWKFADEWTLNARLPHPRLEYDLNDRLQAYLGASAELGTFRIGDRFGDDHGRPDLNHAIVDYFEVRAGPGFTWKIRPNMTVEANAGYMLYRGFDFSKRDLIFRSDPAPYVRIACHLRF